MTVTAISRLEPILEPVIAQAGFQLVRLRMMGGVPQTLQVMAERPDGSMDVEGCTELSRALLDFIEQHDPIEGEYELEVSSPGIDRPLTRPQDFSRWSGHEARIELDGLYEGRKRWRGTVLGLDGADVMIRAGDAGSGGRDIRFPFRSVVNAKLVLTDKLIQEDLKVRKKTDSTGED